MKTSNNIQSNENKNRVYNREFAEHERVIVTGNWGHSGGKPVTKEVGTVYAYDPAGNVYWVLFRSGHGDGNSWHKADELAHVPTWIKSGAQVRNIKGWHEGEPFTILNAACAERVTMTTADGFKFTADAVEIMSDYEPISTAPQRETATLEDSGEITEADGIKVGDTVRHNWTGDHAATVAAIRRAQGYRWEGEIIVFRLDYGHSVTGPAQMEMNLGEYRREALTPCTPDGRELLPPPPAEITISTDTEAA